MQLASGAVDVLAATVAEQAGDDEGSDVQAPLPEEEGGEGADGAAGPEASAAEAEAEQPEVLPEGEPGGARKGAGDSASAEDGAETAAVDENAGVPSPGEADATVASAGPAPTVEREAAHPDDAGSATAKAAVRDDAGAAPSQDASQESGEGVSESAAATALQRKEMGAARLQLRRSRRRRISSAERAAAREAATREAVDGLVAIGQLIGLPVTAESSPSWGELLAWARQYERGRSPSPAPTFALWERFQRDSKRFAKLTRRVPGVVTGKQELWRRLSLMSSALHMAAYTISVRFGQRRDFRQAKQAKREKEQRADLSQLLAALRASTKPIAVPPDLPRILELETEPGAYITRNMKKLVVPERPWDVSPSTRRERLAQFVVASRLPGFHRLWQTYAPTWELHKAAYVSQLTTWMTGAHAMRQRLVAYQQRITALRRGIVKLIRSPLGVKFYRLLQGYVTRLWRPWRQIAWGQGMGKFNGLRTIQQAISSYPATVAGIQRLSIRSQAAAAMWMADERTNLVTQSGKGKLEDAVWQAGKAAGYPRWVMVMVLKYTGKKYGNANITNKNWRRGLRKGHLPELKQAVCDQIAEIAQTQRGVKLPAFPGLTGQASFYATKAKEARQRKRAEGAATQVAGQNPTEVAWFRPGKGITAAEIKPGTVVFWLGWRNVFKHENISRWNVAVPNFAPQYAGGDEVVDLKSAPVASPTATKGLSQGAWEYWQVAPGTNVDELAAWDPFQAAFENWSRQGRFRWMANAAYINWISKAKRWRGKRPAPSFPTGFFLRFPKPAEAIRQAIRKAEEKIALAKQERERQTKRWKKDRAQKRIDELGAVLEKLGKQVHDAVEIDRSQCELLAWPHVEVVARVLPGGSMLEMIQTGRGGPAGIRQLALRTINSHRFWLGYIASGQTDDTPATEESRPTDL